VCTNADIRNVIMKCSSLIRTLRHTSNYPSNLYLRILNPDTHLIIHEVQYANLPSLIQVNKEDRVVPETRYSMSRRHRYNESEHIVDERIESFIHKCSPWHMRHGFQFVIHKQLRQHKEESECINAIHQGIYAPRIPTAKNA